MNDCDVCIVGQGLAGSVLALQLHLSGQKVYIINKEDFHCSSFVAAGLINPITGKNKLKTWLADKLFPYLHTFYYNAESILGQKFFYPKPICMPYDSIEVQNQWVAKSAEIEWRPFVNTETDFSLLINKIYQPYGHMQILQSAWLDIPALILAVKKHFQSLSCYLNLNIEDATDIHNQLAKNNIRAKKVIFCEGVAALNNPFFKHLPLRPNKGEILDLSINNLNIDVIINKGVFLLPMQGDKYRCGSTYSNSFEDGLQITEEAKEEITEKLKGYLQNYVYSITAHKASVRPATVDRKPILGFLPNNQDIGIFNGLGSKGASLAPYFSHIFTENILKGTELPKEVSIQRFFDRKMM